MKNIILPRRVELALTGSYFSNRGQCAEKRFANALILGGVSSVKLSASYWIGRKKDRDGCSISPNSIEANGGIRVNGNHILWAILKRLGVGFSGGGDGKGWAQASWDTQGKSTSYATYEVYKNMDLPMVVHYFNEMKDLPE